MTLVPMAFQGALGTQAMLDPSIGDGTGVAAAMAKIVGGGAWVANAVVVMLMLSILLIVMTSMMGRRARCTRHRSTAGCRSTCRT